MADTQAESSPLIVVGIDGSESSKDALRWAVAQAKATGATIECLAAWHWPTSWGAAVPLPDGFDPASDAGAMIDQTVAPIVALHPEVTVVSRVAEGQAALALIERSHDADLLVVGSRGHGEFSGMLLGSVSQHCAANAFCPVLVFRGHHESEV